MLQQWSVDELLGEVSHEERVVGDSAARKLPLQEVSAKFIETHSLNYMYHGMSRVTI